jgi:protein-tyrosine kinase
MDKMEITSEKVKMEKEAVDATILYKDEGTAVSGSMLDGEIKQSQHDVNPVYSSTRRELTDREVLRRNKIIALIHEDSAVDQLKILYTQVLNRLEETGGNSLLVTSPGPKEGKTLTAINLAISLSQKIDRTVLLVDADLRSPSIHKYLGLHPLKGLSEYLLREAEIPELLINPDIAKLVFLPGGRPLPNSTELLASPRMKDLVQQMKS